jgi:hypothetical protein
MDLIILLLLLSSSSAAAASLGTLPVARTTQDALKVIIYSLEVVQQRVSSDLGAICITSISKE